MKNYQLVSVDSLKELLQHDYQFIDLREPSQYNQLHVKKFVNIPYNNFSQSLPKLSKDIPIYLICYSGQRSKELARQLNNLGYQAYSFDGGFYALIYPINNKYY